MQLTEKVIKVVLAILFLLCLLHMPYGFYQVARFAGLVGFAILAYQANEQSNKTEVIVYVSLALLFQPFLKLSFGREIWNVIDVIVASGLVLSIFMKKKAV